MIIDCHCHLDERVLTVEEMLPKMDEAGVDKVALMGLVVDPFPEPSPFLVSQLQFLLTHRSLHGLAKRFTAVFTPEGDIKIQGKTCHIYPDPDNEPVFQAVKKHPRRFLGWIFVNPRGKKDQVAEFEKYKDAPGVIGVKAHSFWHHYAPAALAPVAQKLAALGKPLLIHVGFGAEGDYDGLLKEVPDLKLILAHAGFPLYGKTWKAIRQRKNIFVDLSQTSYVGERTTRQAVEYLGVEQCLFGTDGPYGFHGKDSKFDYGFIKRRIERLFPDEGVRRRLLGENFAELAGVK